MAINIEIVYANPDDQRLLQREVNSNTTIKAAILQSRLLDNFPEINLEINNVGIFGKKVSLDTVVKEGDRIEIYRPLVCSPKEARRLRAKK
jgi:putative ubiquitin-RnfH superfamily antitoxin RatB of RatAB toxin-antitoxin module